MIRAFCSGIAICALFVLTPLSATAQAEPSGTSRSTSNTALSAKQAGITRNALQEHTRQTATVEAGTTSALTQSRSRRGQTLMIVGGAAFLAGLIIGDDAGTAIAVAGAAIGIYGLYLWAQ